MIKAGIKKVIRFFTGMVDSGIIGSENYVIVSNNCWGAEIYISRNKPYNTPFVGLFIYGPCYIKLLERFEHYLGLELQFREQSKYLDIKIDYPVGILDDVEIHFLHYKGEEEAREKWTRRSKRMLEVVDHDLFHFKICDRDGANPEIIDRFHRLPYKNKISFGIGANSSRDHVVITENDHGLCVPDGKSLYRITFRYVDLFYWLKTGRFRNNIYSRMKAFANLA